MTNNRRLYVPDPLGRLLEPEQPGSFDLVQPFVLGKAVGAGGNNARANVAKIETLLGLAGVMDLKQTDGPTGYAGQRLLDGIRAFQKQNGLNVDGRAAPDGPTIKALSQSLQSMGRNGDSVLAHLSP
ncbi:MAG: peptidoglycan-binding protein [Rhodospirillaceae bacterium]|nr:peptidoglycan-binding protein [Rhodospirillaceae bacterium]